MRVQVREAGEHSSSSQDLLLKRMVKWPNLIPQTMEQGTTDSREAIKNIHEISAAPILLLLRPFQAIRSKTQSFAIGSLLGNIFMDSI
jgi:hypothetical protein